MTNAELLAKIKAEIERLIEMNKTKTGFPAGTMCAVRIEAYQKLLSFLSTLEESEKPMNLEGLEEELDKFYGMYRKDGKTYDITSDEEVSDWKENGNFLSEIELARHFAKWGKEQGYREGFLEGTKIQREEDNQLYGTFTAPNYLKEAADNYIHEVTDAAGHPGWEWVTRDIADAFIAGAEWQKEQDEKELSEKIASAYQLGLADKEKQMLKEAVEGEVNTYRDLVAGKSWAEFVVEKPPKNLGDKVRIIVLKKED